MAKTNVDIIVAAAQYPVQVISGDAAIVVSGLTPSTLVALTKGSAAALTLADPDSTMDGLIVQVYSETAFAHVITAGTSGFNGKGSSGTATFGAAKGNSLKLTARSGKWWVLSNIGVTIA